MVQMVRDARAVERREYDVDLREKVRTPSGTETGSKALIQAGRLVFVGVVCAACSLSASPTK